MLQEPSATSLPQPFSFSTPIAPQASALKNLLSSRRAAGPVSVDPLACLSAQKSLQQEFLSTMSAERSVGSGSQRLRARAKGMAGSWSSRLQHLLTDMKSQQESLVEGRGTEDNSEVLVLKVLSRQWEAHLIKCVCEIQRGSVACAGAPQGPNGTNSNRELKISRPPDQGRATACQGTCIQSGPSIVAQGMMAPITPTWARMASLEDTTPWTIVHLVASAKVPGASSIMEGNTVLLYPPWQYTLLSGAGPPILTAHLFVCKT